MMIKLDIHSDDYSFLLYFNFQPYPSSQPSEFGDNAQFSDVSQSCCAYNSHIFLLEYVAASLSSCTEDIWLPTSSL